MEHMPLLKLNSILSRLVSEGCKEWPSPVATKLGVLSNDQTGEKFLGIVAFLDSLASFLGSILISIYINDPEKKFENKNFNQGIFNFLNKSPTLGEWIGVIREGLNYFEKKTDFFLPELQKFALGIEDPLKVTNNPIKIVKMSEKDISRGLLDELNPFRLTVGHPEKLPDYLKKHNITYDPQDDSGSLREKALPYVLSDLIRLLYGLKFLSDYWLFYVKNLREEEEGRFADVYLYSSIHPLNNEELYVTDCKGELLKDKNFEQEIFRNRLFFGKVKTEGDILVETTRLERVIEVNPVIINWLREREKEKEYLPHRFLQWKKKNTKQILMGDIIYQKGAEEVDHLDTREHLWEIYTVLKSRLNILSEKEEDNIEVKTPINVSHCQSNQRYLVVRKEIYPHFNIADEILAGIEIEKKTDENILDVHVSLTSVSNKETGKRGEYFTFRNAVEKLWDNPDRWNCTLIGEGGMGKTTSLLKLWESFLSGDERASVPIFLSLEKYNHLIDDEQRKKFIWHRISLEYLNRIPSSEEIRDIKNQFTQKIKVNGKEYPSIILLLDGFNEVTADNRELLLSLKEIKEFKGVQIIISSRYDMRQSLGWTNFEGLKLEELEDEQIKSFMTSQRLEFNNELGITPLLRNPMMLTLYCGSEREMKLNSGKEDYDFILNSRYKAVILHNFIVSSIVRLDRLMVTEEDKILHRLSLKYLLPRIGYEMEKEGLFEISHKEILDIIREEFFRYCSNEFLDLHPQMDIQINKVKSLLNAGNRKNITEIIRRLKERYCLIKGQEGGPYAFLHQHFRDYFAAFYIKDRTQERINSSDNNFPELACRFFAVHLRSMLGELVGEPRRSPFIQGGYQKGEIKETLLDSALDVLRHREMKKDDYRILNILEILKDKRVDLSDTDLSQLDLRRVILNNVRLGHGKIGGKRRRANLEGSKLKAYNILPHGHTSTVTTVSYSPNGRRIVSGSVDKTIKEWDTETGECIRTYIGHSRDVNSVSYSSDGHSIVSGSRDRTIKEWDIETGECIRTYRWRAIHITSVSYSSDGHRIVSGSLNKRINEWDTETGKCIRIYTGHSRDVNSVSYISDGKRILSGSSDETIKEWDTKTGECIRTYRGHFGRVISVSYSNNGKKIVSGSKDKTIKEWDVETGECIKTYTGHSFDVTSVSYSNDDYKIVSGSVDKTIKEWDTETGECIRTYRGRSSNVTSASYSSDGKRIISGSRDKTIKEWDTETGECIRTYIGHYSYITSVSYSSDGKKVVSGSVDGTIKEWDTETGECVRTYKGHYSYVNSISYNSDGNKIVSGSRDKTIKEWDTETGECIKTYTGHSREVTSVSYSSDGKKIISGSLDRTIKEWDTETGGCIKTIRDIPGLFIHGVDMSDIRPDSEITEEEKKILEQYGAILDVPKRSGKKDIVIVE
jgi:WD40 repeat protein